MPEEFFPRKVSIVYRVLAAIICLVAVLVGLGIAIFAIRDSLALGVVLFLVPVILFYVSFPVALNGYPPKLLMWTTDKK